MHLLKFAFVWSASVGHCLAMTFVHSVRPTSWKKLTHQVKECWTIILLSIKNSSQNLWLEIGEREYREVLSSKSCLVRSNVSCNLLSSFLKGNLDLIRLFQAFFDQIVWYTIGVVSCTHGTLDVCMVNKVCKCHSMCQTVDSVYVAFETQQRVFHQISKYSISKPNRWS